jgi:hypothetical protein
MIIYQKKQICSLPTDKRGSKYLNKDFYLYEIIDTPKLNNIIFLLPNLIKVFFLILNLFFIKKKKLKNYFYRWIYVLTINFSSKIIKLKFIY